MKRFAICLAALAALAGCSGSDEDKPPLDANARYLVAITSASVKATNNGATWDVSGAYEAPDVFCRFDDGTTTTDTAYVDDSYSPTWSTSNGVYATVAVLRSGNFTVQLWDYDPYDPNDPITNVGAVTLTDDQIRSGSLGFTNWDGADTITFHITPAP